MIDYSAAFALETNLAYTFQWFNVNGGGILNVATPALLSAHQTTELVFQPQGTEQMRYRFGDLFVVFGMAEQLNSTNFRAYRREPEQLAIEVPFGYIARASWRTRFAAETRNGAAGDRDVFKIGIIGRKSDAADPFPASLNYSGAGTARGGPLDRDGVYGAGQSTFGYTPSSNSVFGSISVFQTVNAAEVQRAALRLDGSSQPVGNLLSGTISDPTFGWSGTWQGNFFGPDRTEIGLTYRVTNTSGDVLVGDFIGKR